MPRIIAMHEVDNGEHWLSSPKREETFKGVMEDIVTFIDRAKPNRVGISATIVDMEAFNAIQSGPVGEAAMKHDGVHPDTIVFLVEA